MKPLDILFKPLRILMLTLVFGAALLIGLLDYLFASEGGSKSLASFITHTYPAISIQNPSGSLLHGLKIEKLSLLPWVEIESLTLEVKGRCLATLSLCVETLEAAQVHVYAQSGATDDQPVVLPRVALPLLIDLRSARVEKLLIHQHGGELVITDLRLQAQAALPQLNVLAAHAEYDGFTADLHGQIALENNYPLDASADILHAESKTAVHLQANNSVAELNLIAAAKQQGTLHLDASLKPLEKLLPLQLKASSEGVFNYLLKDGKNLQLDQLQLNANGNLQKLNLHGNIHIAGSAAPETHAELQAQLTQQHLQVDSLLLRTLGGEANAQGALAFSDAFRWQATWQIKDIQTQQYWPDIQSMLNGNGSSEGSIKGEQLSYQLMIEKLSGQWRNYVLNASGAVKHENNFWQLDDVNFQLGNNSVKLAGSINHEWNMRGDIRAPMLRAFWPTLAGELNGQFTLSGVPQAPTIAADLTAKKLVFDTIRVNTASLKSSIVKLAEQNSTLKLHAEGMEISGYDVDVLDLTAIGQQSAHFLTLVLNGPSTRVNAEVNGKWSGKAWDGNLQTARLLLKSSALAEWSLSQPLPMSWRNKAGFKIDAFCWQHDSASLCSDGPIVLGPKGKLGISLQGLQTAWLEPHFPDGFRWAATLNMQANLGWEPNAATIADIKVASTPGVIRLEQPNAAPLEFQYQQLSAISNLRNNSLNTQVLFSSSSLGKLDSEVNISLKAQGDRTLDGQLNLTGFQLNIFKPFYEKLDKLEGVLSADGRIAGSLAAPKFIGIVNLQDGKISAENLPLPIENLQAQAQLYGSNAILKGHFGSGKGSANLDGQLDWTTALQGNLKLSGENLQLRPTRGLKMIVQPDLNAALNDSILNITGKVAVTEGTLTTKALPVDAIEESGDTVVVGEQKIKNSNLKISTDVLVTIADKFNFTGFGAEGRLAGELRVTQSPEQDLPHADGEIKVSDGKYTIYGQRLTIRTGQILFGGPVDLPIVQIEAIRKIEDIVVGIRIFGRVDQPTSTLFSEPSLPEETALSYLVTGRPPSTGNTTQSNNYMGQAAVALGVMGGEGVARDVAEKIGVSDFSLSSDTTTEGKQLVAVAGYISPKLYVRYGMGVFEPGNTVTLRYNLTPKLYFEAVNGLQSALDLIYTFDIGKKDVAAPTSSP